MAVELTDEQQIVLDAVKDWWYNSDEQIFQYCGYPGTGKTFILYEIIKELGIDMKRIAPMAYIGKAAINMRLNGLINAKTIHSWIYELREEFEYDKNGEIVIDKYFNKPKVKLNFVYNPVLLENIDLIIIDEAGSVPLSLKKDIERAGIKIIATGDLGQLPPPCDNPAYLKSGKIYRLTKIMRQKDHENNGILKLATLARYGEDIKYGKYGNNCLVIPESKLTDDIIRTSDILICAKNKTRDKYNKYIREQVYGQNYMLPTYGEILICRENRWNVESNGINLANGLRGVVTNFPDVSTFKKDKYVIDFKPIGVDDCIFKNIKGDYEFLNSNYDVRNAIKSSRYSGDGVKFEYGYAISTHMAQGSQYNSGIFIAESFGSLTSKLHFTAITRFKKKLYYVKPD